MFRFNFELPAGFENTAPFERFAELARPIVRRTTFEIERDMKQSMTGPKTGRFYRVGRISRALGKQGRPFKGARTYQTAKGNTRVIVGARVRQASAPGEAPAINTGALRNSIQSSFSNDGLTGTITVGKGYGLFLDMGTIHMDPRPYGRITLETRKRGFIDRLRDALVKTSRS